MKYKTADEIIELIQKRIEELKVLFDNENDHAKAMKIYGAYNELEMIIEKTTI